MNTYEIQKDLQKALENIDKNDYILRSLIAHLEEQCTEEEVKLVEDKIFELEPKEYDNREDFLEDYQPIFDLVEFPFKDCFRLFDKRQLNWDAL
ncbi:MAG: hypothetical protein KBG30_13185 [Bacteroidales bacterium]|nr:hypothetical protein [Bacteroidales bacterium]